MAYPFVHIRIESCCPLATLRHLPAGSASRFHTSGILDIKIGGCLELALLFGGTLVSTAKRSGSRDISDLKARLGLKKKAPPAQPSAVPPPAGAIPPPRQTGAVPVPPGVLPPPPPQQQPYVPQQAVPDAADDPFGAMNAMAANQAAVATAAPPPVMIVNDGMPVASVEAKGGALRYAKIAGMILGPLVIGMIVGQIGSSAKHYNRVIEDSGKIRDDVDTVGKQLLNLQSILQVAQERGPKNKEGKPWYALGDEKLTKEIAALPPLSYDSDLIYGSFVYDLPPQISEQIFLYYTEIGQLKKLLSEHVKKSPKNVEQIKAAMGRVGGFNPQGFAMLITAPSAEEAKRNQPTMARMVQLGRPICEAGGKPADSACQSIPAESQYRLSETGNWGVKKVVGPGSAIANGSLIMINPGTPFFMGIVKGGGATVAESTYMDRITAIHSKVNDLVGVRKFILDVLNNKANESKKFTFFM